MPSLQQDKPGRTIPGLVLTNMIPLLGMFVFGWDALELMLVFWLEGFVLGLFVIARVYVRPPWRIGSLLIRLYPLLFLLLAWLSFVISHLLAILVVGHLEPSADAEDWDAVFEDLRILIGERWIWLAALLLLVDQAWRFGRDWIKAQGWNATGILRLVGALFGRVILIQIVVMIGLALILHYEAHRAFVVLMVLAKIGMDLLALQVSRAFDRA